MFAPLFRKKSARSGPAPQRRACLGVESLEGRAVPSAALASVPAHFGPTNSGVQVQMRIGDEIPARSGPGVLKAGDEIPAILGSTGPDVHVQLFGIGEEIPQQRG